jgi:hypothetical protein
MSRKKPRRRITRATLLVTLVSLLSVGAAASCSAFDLGDVVGSSDAASGPTDAPIEAGGGAPSDAATADDFGPCTDSGDSCGCVLPEDVSSAARGNGEGIVVSGSTVYFLVFNFPDTTTDSTLFSAPVTGLAGAAPTQVSIPDPLNAASMTLAGPVIVFKHGAAPGDIRAIALTDNMLPPQRYFDPPELPFNSFAADSKRIYFGNGEGVICGVPYPVPGSPHDAGTLGCGLTPVVPPSGIPSGALIAANDTSVFYSNQGDVYAAPQSTGAVAKIYNGIPTISGFVESNGSLFWSRLTGDGGTIWSVQDDGGNPATIVQSPIEGGVSAATIAVDSDGIYWGARSYDRISGAARDGTNQRLLACDTEGVSGITTDATYVYWVNNSGRVKRAKKNP